MHLRRRVLMSDTFNRADNVDLGANWDAGYTGDTNLQIVTNRVRGTSTTLDATETWNGPVMAGDQWAEMTIPTFAGAGTKAPRLMLCMKPPPTKSGYEFAALTVDTGTTTRVTRWTAGAYEAQGHSLITWVSGDVIRAEIRASALYIYRNNGSNPVLVVEKGSFGAGTGAVYNEGRAGVLIYSVVIADTEIDTWSAGDFVQDRMEFANFPKHKHREAILRGEI